MDAKLVCQTVGVALSARNGIAPKKNFGPTCTTRTQGLCYAYNLGMQTIRLNMEVVR
jgi:hypothetical protein